MPTSILSLSSVHYHEERQDSSCQLYLHLARGKAFLLFLKLFGDKYFYQYQFRLGGGGGGGTKLALDKRNF